MKHSKQNSAQIAETLRRYYLDTMGIQGWELNQPDEVKHAKVGFTEKAQAAQQPVSLSAQASPGLSLLQQQILSCDACALSTTPSHRAVGSGNPAANLMLVLLGPVACEDQHGNVSNNRLMSAAASQLLAKMLQAIDIDINDVFITSLFKCVMPANHTIMPGEVATCCQHLNQQIVSIGPKLLFVMGETAAQCLLGCSDNITTLREHQYEYAHLPVRVSYAADDLLMRPEDKRRAWADLQQLQQQLQPQL